MSSSTALREQVQAIVDRTDPADLVEAIVAWAATSDLLAAAAVTPGEMDLTPNGNCPARHPLGYLCTWPAGHKIAHVAGDGDEVIVTWPLGPSTDLNTPKECPA